MYLDYPYTHSRPTLFSSSPSTEQRHRRPPPALTGTKQRLPPRKGTAWPESTRPVNRGCSSTSLSTQRDPS
ncbi:hypothetical protein BDW69DRAFT_158663 [Aspergillus filifer]